MKTIKLSIILLVVILVGIASTYAKNCPVPFEEKDGIIIIRAETKSNYATNLPNSSANVREIKSQGEGTKKFFALKSNFNIYPNPVTNGTITIEKSFEEEADLALYNIEGKLVYSIQIKSQITSISDLHMAPGMYLLKIYSKNEGEHTFRIIFK